MKRASIIFSMLVLISMLIIVAPVGASTHQTFYMKKACSGPGVCSIIYATAPFDVFENTAVTYSNHHFGYDASGNLHMTADITLTAADPQNTVSGIVSWVLHDGVFTGHISLQNGTGSFEGVHARGDIGALGGGVFFFSGDYFFTP